MKSICPILICLISYGLSLVLLSQVAKAEVRYVWLPDSGSGGHGSIRFDEAHIAAAADGVNTIYTDEMNFITSFDGPSVVNVAFSFDNKVIIEDAVIFVSRLSLQNH